MCSTYELCIAKVFPPRPLNHFHKFVTLQSQTLMHLIVILCVKPTQSGVKVGREIEILRMCCPCLFSQLSDCLSLQTAQTQSDWIKSCHKFS